MSTTTAASPTVDIGNTLKRIASQPALGGPSINPSSLSSPAMTSVSSGSLGSGNDELPIGGHAMASGNGNAIGSGGLGNKADYRMVGISEDDDDALQQHASRNMHRGGSGLLSVPEPAQHPALPIASYCIASIVMTVVNKVSTGAN